MPLEPCRRGFSASGGAFIRHNTDIAADGNLGLQPPQSMSCTVCCLPILPDRQHAERPHEAHFAPHGLLNASQTRYFEHCVLWGCVQDSLNDLLMLIHCHCHKETRHGLPLRRQILQLVLLTPPTCVLRTDQVATWSGIATFSASSW